MYETYDDIHRDLDIADTIGTAIQRHVRRNMSQVYSNELLTLIKSIIKMPNYRKLTVFNFLLGHEASLGMHIYTTDITIDNFCHTVRP